MISLLNLSTWATNVVGKHFLATCGKHLALTLTPFARVAGNSSLRCGDLCAKEAKCQGYNVDDFGRQCDMFNAEISENCSDQQLFVASSATYFALNVSR